jgi:hypothetical protein
LKKPVSKKPSSNPVNVLKKIEWHVKASKNSASFISPGGIVNQAAEPLQINDQKTTISAGKIPSVLLLCRLPG